MKGRKEPKPIPINEEWIAVPQTYRGNESYQLQATDGRVIRLRPIGPGRWASSRMLMEGHAGPRIRVRGDLVTAAVEAIRKHFETRPVDKLIGTVAGEWVEHKSHHVKPESLRHYEDNALYFVRWAASAGLMYWSELKKTDALKYYDHLLDARFGKDGKPYSDKIIKDRLVVLKAMSGWASGDDQSIYRDFAKGIVHRKRRGMVRFDDLGEAPYLSFNELYEFILWLWVNEPERPFLAIGAALQGYCGMRLTEVVRLTWDRVDLHAGRITIEGETKNEHSVRRIPIPRQVADLLGVIPRIDHRVTPCTSRTTYSMALSAALQVWRPGIKVVPKDLRKSLPSVARSEGWYGYEVRQYLGHAPADITEAAYVRSTKAQQEELFRSNVVAHVERALDLLGGFRQCFSNAGNVVRLQEAGRRA